MAKLVRPIFIFIAKITSFSTSLALAAAISANIATVYGVFYALAIGFPLTEFMFIVGAISWGIAWIIHPWLVGMFSKIGIPAGLKSGRQINKVFYIEDNQVKIRQDLEDEDYQATLRALIYYPLHNTVIAIVSVQFIMGALMAAGLWNGDLNLDDHLVPSLIMNGIFTYIHAGVCLLLCEMAAGIYLRRIKTLLHQKGIEFQQKAYSSVTIKFAFMLILTFINVYVAATLVYKNQERLESVWGFSALALFVALFIAYIIFKIIYRALEDVILAMKDLQSGGSGLLFTTSVDKEFIDVAQGVTSAAQTIKDYQENLEQKIEERTRELEQSLVRVRDLKGQQDGDYFLTSLLMKPLSGNYANNRTVKVSFYQRQKKSFEFRKRKNDLGGDMCISHSIELRGRPFTVFLNADAMGKSMQGAGGSLVLGAVFQSIIERTRLSEDVQAMFPEKWLKTTFLELHKTFESFDGSMLISVAFGMVDELNGAVYYLNAEHPWTVLYREETARFIEDSLKLRKLGTLGMENAIPVEVLQLKPGDILMAGSDGRDDLMLGRGDDSSRIINEDETLFLRCVERGDGDIDRIVEVLAGIGEFTDDLSLMSLKFEGPPDSPADLSETERRAEAQFLREAQQALKADRVHQAVGTLVDGLERFPDSPKIQKALAWSHYKNRDYAAAAPLFEKILNLEPLSENMILALVRCYNMTGRDNAALPWLERLRLRQPDNFKWLGYLIPFYWETNRHEKARSKMDRFLRRHPDNERARKFWEAWQKRISA